MYFGIVSKELERNDSIFLDRSVLFLPKQDVEEHIVSYLDEHLKHKLHVKHEALKVVLFHETHTKYNVKSFYALGDYYLLESLKKLVKGCELEVSDRVSFQLKEVVGKELHFYFSFEKFQSNLIFSFTNNS